MGLFDSIIGLAKKGVGELEQDGKRIANRVEGKSAGPSEDDEFKKFLGKFGHYTEQSMSSKFGTPKTSNFKLQTSKPNVSFKDANNDAKKLGYDYLIYVGDSPHSGQAYYGVELDENYNLNNVSAEDPTSGSFNVYPVYEINDPTKGMSQIDQSVVNYYTKKVLTNMRSKLEEDIKKIQEQKKMTDAMADAYKWCENNSKDFQSVEDCAKIQYEKNYKNIDDINEKQEKLKKLNDQLNILRMKNRYETETKNQLIGHNTKNNTFFSSIKNALTDNHNSISKVKDTILNVSNKLKTNNNILGMRTNVIGTLTTVVIVMIILAIGFLAYFAYQSAKKYFPFTLQGFRASQASASAPPSQSSTNKTNSTTGSGSNSNSNSLNPRGTSNSTSKSAISSGLGF